MEKLIITAAICGAEVRKVDNKNLPTTPEELAAAAKEAENAGASVIHLHVRDENGMPTQDVEVFRKTIELMEQKGVRAIIQPSTGGAVNMSHEERLQPVVLKPEMASLDCGSINFGENDVFINTPEMIRSFAHRLLSLNILPELECFDIGHVSNALNICRGELSLKHLHFNFVLGLKGGIPAAVEHLLMMISMLPSGATWTVSGIGRHQLDMVYHAIPLGGHIRVGFEDNIYYSYRVLADSNAQLVARVAHLAKEYGREIACPDEARKILKIS
jgi:3-keto-5-aminohexanoate cleavage enzyme